MPRFLQSKTDFPMTVSLGGRVPEWGLSRWGKRGLMFRPLDEEGFSIRGDGRQILYKGRTKSHRFTILGGEAFEYDCILEKEPDSNVVTLGIEGAEKYDFYRQPDFVKDPFLKGSYAVYKKEVLAGPIRVSEGTGKLCHIKRPLVIDALGRRVWGDLCIDGVRGLLTITIPEEWLAHAKYPVVVDPTVGTTTVGSQTHVNNGGGDDDISLVGLDAQIGVNKFVLPDTFQGQAQGYVYNYLNQYFCASDPVIPLLYSDSNNFPYLRKSSNEGQIDSKIGPGKPAGWRSAAFTVTESLAAGQPVWFGLGAFEFYFLFDYGAVYNFADCYELDEGVAPNPFPQDYKNWTKNYKISWYFTYTAGQVYARTLTQGVSLGDSRAVAAGYCRGVTEEAGITGDAHRQGEYHRTMVDEAVALGEAARHLLIEVVILTGLFIRDYVLGRLIKSKEDLIVKSAMCREIEIESRLR